MNCALRCLACSDPERCPWRSEPPVEPFGAFREVDEEEVERLATLARRLEAEQLVAEGVLEEITRRDLERTSRKGGS